jgi:phage baseplate assembly protein W
MAQKTYINIQFPFQNDSENKFLELTRDAKRAIKSDLIHLLLTNKGERFFYPEFGGNLRASLFEPDISFDVIAANLRNEILAYVPNIILNDISVNRISDENLVNIVIDYSINKQQDNLVVSVSTTDLINQ